MMDDVIGFNVMELTSTTCDVLETADYCTSLLPTSRA
jgi:hypothetical protein